MFHTNIQKIILLGNIFKTFIKYIRGRFIIIYIKSTFQNVNLIFLA